VMYVFMRIPFPLLMASVLLHACSAERQAVRSCCARSVPDELAVIEKPRCFRSAEASDDGIFPDPAQEIVLSNVARPPDDKEQSYNYFRDRTLVFFRAAPRAPEAVSSLPYGLRWSPKVGGTFALHWSNGYVGGTMCLEEGEGTLEGTVEEYSDIGPPWSGLVLLVEQPCEASDD